MPKTSTKSRTQKPAPATFTPALTNFGHSEDAPPSAIEVLAEFGVELSESSGVVRRRFDPPTGKDLELMRWFLNLPALLLPPFELRPAVTVRGGQFYTQLEHEVRKAIEQPENCARWRSGALIRDLQDLLKLTEKN